MATSFITSMSVQDVRFPTSLDHDGSDALHPDPDYSCAYVVLSTDLGIKGHGFSFTLGRGTEIVVQAVKCFQHLIIGQNVRTILLDFASFWRKLTHESQIMWLGPEKGVVHLAVSAVVNAIWDLWARLEGKPLWKLVVDMTPEQLLSVIDFSYLTDVLTKEDALAILKKNETTKHIRESEMKQTGYQAYTTHCGWMGYSDEKIRKLCRESLAEGFTRFKVKVGISLEDDNRRLTVVREAIGYENTLMVDANQCWDVPVAIDWVKQLAPFKPLWIEEPTSPDDALGHAAISKVYLTRKFKPLQTVLPFTKQYSSLYLT